MLLTVHDLDQFAAFLFHVDDQFVHTALKEAMEHESGDGHRQAGGCGDKRLRDAAGENIRISGTFQHQLGKHLDHTYNRSQQSEPAAIPMR